MANIIYSKMNVKNDAMYGKIDTPVKMCIEREADRQEQMRGVMKALYVTANSKRFAETILGQSDFGVFKMTPEGAGAENDSIEGTYKKEISFFQFMKEFAITQEMMEDAKFGIADEAKRRAQAFTRAYYKTQNNAAALALVNATAKSFKYAGADIDTTSYDALPLFHKAHKYVSDKMEKKTMSNRFCAENLFSSSDAFETALNVFGNIIRNYEDENGEVNGYCADTIILPGNCPKAEAAARRAVGNERAANGKFNDVNLAYGQYDIVIIPEWQVDPTKPKFALMSREANDNLQGNMFYNRVPLTIQSWVDHHTWNNIWSGRCRFGLGFGNHRHIALIEEGASVDGCTPVTLT